MQIMNVRVTIWERFQMSDGTKLRCLGFALLRCDWQEDLAPLSRASHQVHAKLRSIF